MNTLIENKSVAKDMATSIGMKIRLIRLFPDFNFGSGVEKAYFTGTFRSLVRLQSTSPFMEVVAQMVEQKEKRAFSSVPCHKHLPMVNNTATSLKMIIRCISLFLGINLSDGEGVSYFLLRRAKANC
jgi:hypothetical protein